MRVLALGFRNIVTFAKFITNFLPRPLPTSGNII